ncbi:MAG TPA: lipid-transfer protein [Acidimicrobiaceae bacterium]|nr:lipid-transfer protein [Acidimicrobiaceae bacterium]
MRDIAVVAFSQRQEAMINTESEVEFMVPLMNEAKDAVGLTQQEMGFTCSGSSDFLAGQAFSFVMTIDGTGPVPPISESHVEQDGAWALYEAWVKLQCGDIDTAFVYSYGKSSPGSLRDVLATQMDPYYVAPLWPDAFAIEAMAARQMLEQGVVSEQQLAEIASRSRAHAASNPHAVRITPKSVDEILAEDFAMAPLRPSDLPASSDGGAVIVLAADDKARELCDRPAWIRGIDHRSDAHTLGVRDLTTSMSARIAAENAGVSNDKIDLAELHAPFSTSEAVLTKALGLGEDTVINPSGGAQAAHTMMASGLIRIGEAAQRISRGDADRAVATAASGPCLQQNLVAVLEGE